MFRLTLNDYKFNNFLYIEKVEGSLEYLVLKLLIVTVKILKSSKITTIWIQAFTRLGLFSKSCFILMMNNFCNI